ncbi:hypothetical protein [Actinacidiphila glaucinigra]|uniref:hypothetical protein n=1 Tax=Actinacidiphila glaucinigra TaxID=235986 RepID=UPI0036734EA7
MSKLKTPRWTLVQHSAWTAKQDPRFKDQVEQGAVTTHQQLGEIVDAGGVTFTDYMAAEDAVDAVNYPDRPFKIDPSTDRFHQSLTIDGRALYLPPSIGTIE